MILHSSTQPISYDSVQWVAASHFERSWRLGVVLAAPHLVMLIYYRWSHEETDEPAVSIERTRSFVDVRYYHLALGPDRFVNGTNSGEHSPNSYLTLPEKWNIRHKLKTDVQFWDHVNKLAVYLRTIKAPEKHKMWS